MEDHLIEVTLIIDFQPHPRTEEKFTFSSLECGRDLDILMDQICYMKGIDRTEDLRLVLAPDFIVLDLDCIEDGDHLIVKQYDEVRPITQIREAQTAQVCAGRRCVGRPRKNMPTLGSAGGTGGYGTGGGGTGGRVRGRRGRPPKSGGVAGDEYGNAAVMRNTYYFSIKQATSG